MKLGIQIPSYTNHSGFKELGSDLKEIVQYIDQHGFSSIWVMDHYYQIDKLFDLPYTEPMLEGYSTLNYFAGLTENVRLGTLVTGSIYRQPAFLIKQVTTMDVLSGGRAYLGIGAGWYKEEAEAYGFPFGTWTDRFEKLEETLQIAKKMWSDDSGPYEGKRYQLGSTYLSPQPINGRVPIMIGGMGEKKTLRMVAQYADATNLFARVGTEVLTHKLEVLKKHCETLNRNYDEIEKTSLGTFDLRDGKDTADDLLDDLKALSDIGIEHAIINLPTLYDLTPLELLKEEVLPVIADY